MGSASRASPVPRTAPAGSHSSRSRCRPVSHPSQSRPSTRLANLGPALTVSKSGGPLTTLSAHFARLGPVPSAPLNSGRGPTPPGKPTLEVGLGPWRLLSRKRRTARGGGACAARPRARATRAVARGHDALSLRVVRPSTAQVGHRCVPGVYRMRFPTRAPSHVPDDDAWRVSLRA